MYEDMLGCHNWGCYWHLTGYEATDAAEHPTKNRTVPHNKESFSLKANSPKMERPCPRETRLHFGNSHVLTGSNFPVNLPLICPLQL